MTDLTPEQAIAHASNRLYMAAICVAVGVDVTDALKSNPNFVADRSPRADQLRAEMAVVNLRRYREASAALDAALRHGDCDGCSSSLAACRAEGESRVCCEDCSHPESCERGQS